MHILGWKVVSGMMCQVLIGMARWLGRQMKVMIVEFERLGGWDVPEYMASEPVCCRRLHPSLLW